MHKSFSLLPLLMDPQPQHQKLQHVSSNSFLIRTNTEVRYALSLLAIFICSIVIPNLVTLQPLSLLHLEFFSQTQSENNKTESASGGCDYSTGRWVWDPSYPSRMYNEICPFLDPGFRCHQSGRNDSDYLKWRWQPQGCELPRFNASELLERSRNGRIVFAGDSIGRNQWESMLCMLAQAVSNQSSIYEENGNPISKHIGYLSMRFHDYNLTVEYYRVPYLVIKGRPPQNSSKEIQSTIKIDKIHWYAKKWEGANVLVFNDGHWWNVQKTIKMGIYFQEGENVNRTMDMMEAFWKSLQTWKSWAMEKLDPERTHLFIHSYSPVHYRNGTWNEGGTCDLSTQPETDYRELEPEPVNNQYISDIIKQMEYGTMKVHFLNITNLSEFRKDAHPSKYREPGTPADAPQDCSHWCLPGVPDTWNELIYAHLMLEGFRTK